MILLAVMCMLIPQKMKKVNAATTIKTGEWYETKTNGEKSVRYSYKVPKSGYFYYEVVPKGYYYFQNNYQKGRSCFSTSLIKSYKEYERAGLASDDKKYKSGRYAFKAGDKVTINFEDSYDTKTPFKFRVVFKKVKNFEKEKVYVGRSGQLETFSFQYPTYHVFMAHAPEGQFTEEQERKL